MSVLYVRDKDGKLKPIYTIQGEDGKSAYQVAVDNGFEGTESEWLESLKGEKGNDGADGKDGTNGKDGVDGKDGTDGKSAYEIAVDNGFEGTEEEWLGSLVGEKGEDGFSEWDHVITSLEDFTTENLATMSGRVLVKGVTYNGADERTDDRPFGRLDITIPNSITLIKFIDCSIFARITGNASTTISGFVGRTAGGDDLDAFPPQLIGFGAVEFCKGSLYLGGCSNIRHCSIREAYNCTNLNDIESKVEYGDGYHASFVYCTVIDNVRISGREDDAHSGYVEFINCSHISNVHGTVPDVPIDYVDCSYVDGDTCDGYYTAEDNGKVQTVNTDGAKSLISVYSQGEIDAKLGDISTILTALHEGGIE